MAASTAALDDALQRNLAIDPSPNVRAALAGRGAELVGDVLTMLRADEHIQVRRALAATGHSGSDTPSNAA